LVALGKFVTLNRDVEPGRTSQRVYNLIPGGMYGDMGRYGKKDPAVRQEKSASTKMDYKTRTVWEKFHVTHDGQGQPQNSEQK